MPETAAPHRAHAAGAPGRIERSQLTERLSEVQAERLRLEKQLRLLTDAIQDVEDRNRLESSNHQLVEQVKVAEAKLAKLDNLLSKVVISDNNVEWQKCSPEAKIAVLLREYQKTRQAQQTAASELEGNRFRLAETTETLIRAETELENTRRQLAEARNHADTEAQRILGLEARVKSAEGERDRLLINLRSLEQQLGDVQNQAERNEANLNDKVRLLTSSVANLETLVSDLKRTLAETERRAADDKNAADSAISSLREQNSTAMVEQASEFNRQIQDMGQRLKGQATEIDSLQTTNGALLKQIERMSENIKQQEQQLDDKTRRLKDTETILQNERAGHYEKIVELNKQYNASLLAQEVELTRQIQELKQKFARQAQDMDAAHLEQIKKITQITQPMGMDSMIAVNPPASMSPNRESLREVHRETSHDTPRTRPEQRTSRRENTRDPENQEMAMHIMSEQSEVYLRIAQEEGLSAADEWLWGEARKRSEIAAH